MLIGLLIVLLITLILPFIYKNAEHNLEIFLFIMGLAAVIVSGILSKELIIEILENKFIYMISFAVLFAGIIFKLLKSNIKNIVNTILKHLSLKVFVFLLIVVLGLMSSVITAIIASLLLVEIVNALPLDRTKKIEINIVACFSIGLGAAMTPIGEPIATIVVSKLNADFWYIFREIGVYIIPGVLLLGILGVYFIGDKNLKDIFVNLKKNKLEEGLDEYFGAEDFDIDEDTNMGIIYRTIKIFIFIIALELLGSGFKPMIDTYVINLDGRLLYWGNMVSAILDNATIAAAEISPKMSEYQIKAILMGLLISGGMLIPGNIPNIVSAGKLKIKSSEWVRIGVPIGLILLVLYYVILFVI